MNPVSRYAFINARIHGMMAGAWLGEKLKSLLQYKSILDLARALYPASDQPSLIVETSALEARIHQDSLDKLVMILGLLESPEPLLVQLVRAYEYQNVKTWLRTRLLGAAAGRYWDLGRFKTVDFTSGDPDFSRNEFRWLKARLEEKDLFELEFELDRSYYSRLGELTDGLTGADKRAVHALVKQEIFLVGLVWILRLRTFFGKAGEELDRLIIPQRDAALREALTRAMHFPLDDLAAWRSWRHFWVLEGQDRPDFRAIDPGAVELAARTRLYRKYRIGLNRNLFTLGPLYCFFRLKESEAAMVQSVLEAVHMGLSEEELLPVLGF
jgi:vacuolar-type H+-ATPase subunit C/Vma6